MCLRSCRWWCEVCANVLNQAVSRSLEPLATACRTAQSRTLPDSGMGESRSISKASVPDVSSCSMSSLDP